MKKNILLLSLTIVAFLFLDVNNANAQSRKGKVKAQAVETNPQQTAQSTVELSINELVKTFDEKLNLDSGQETQLKDLATTYFNGLERIKEDDSLEHAEMKAQAGELRKNFHQDFMKILNQEQLEIYLKNSGQSRAKQSQKGKTKTIEAKTSSEPHIQPK